MILSGIIPTFDELESSHDPHLLTNDPVGDPLDEVPNQDTTRIYFQNLNGLGWTKDGGKWPYICDTLAGIQVDVACFSEINTDTNRYEIRRKMETVSRRQFDHSQIVSSTSKFPTTTSYKPGGTAIMTCGTITSTVQSHSRDRMGRWTSIRLTTSPTQHIRIISAYQVCPEIRTGSNSAASQQQAQLISEEACSSNRRRSPREAFKQDLQSFIQQCQSNGDDIILVGDFNEEMTSEQSGMYNLAAACGLTDLFAVRLGTSTYPATYQRGPRRIDYALITPRLLNHVHAAGYDPF
jgi:endonuclease/exonuclease/phosphatase family metal-dependent hydrolase